MTSGTKEPAYPPVTELDARKVTPPPRVQEVSPETATKMEAAK